MKLKFILSTLIFVIVFGATLLQVKAPVRAISPPVTSPITFAMLQVSGVVRYLDLTVYRFMPAEGVEVEAKNKKTDETFMTTTDADGKYSLQVNPGKYTLMASDDGDFADNKFVPKISTLPVLFNFPHLDFFGIPKL